MDAALIALDVLLVIGLDLRLTRLVVYDYLGDWWIVQPSQHFATRRWGRTSKPYDYVEKLLDCPFCIGFHISWASVLSLYLVGGVGDAADWWRWVAAAFALNYVQGHINARLDGD